MAKIYDGYDANLNGEYVLKEIQKKKDTFSDKDQHEFDYGYTNWMMKIVQKSYKDDIESSNFAWPESNFCFKYHGKKFLLIGNLKELIPEL